MLNLTPKRITALCLGSTFLATGGGFPFSTKLAKMQLLSKQSSLLLHNTEDFSDDDFACAISGIGSAADTQNIDLGTTLKKGLALLEKTIHQKIKVIIPGEIGIENIMFEIGRLVNLPILDADTAGRRAVPEMNQDTFFIAGESILPCVIITLEGKTEIIDKKGDDLLVETKARNLAINSPNKVAFIFSHARPIKLLKKIIALNSLSLSIKIGQILQTKNLATIQQRLNNLVNAKIIVQGKITVVSHKENNGFLTKLFELTDNNNTYQIHIKNEILAVYCKNKIKSVIPDSICVLDSINFLPLHSSELTIGKNIIIFEIPAIPQWKTERGQNLFGTNYL